MTRLQILRNTILDWACQHNVYEIVAQSYREEDPLSGSELFFQLALCHACLQNEVSVINQIIAAGITPSHESVSGIYINHETRRQDLFSQHVTPNLVNKPNRRI